MKNKKYMLYGIVSLLLFILVVFMATKGRVVNMYNEYNKYNAGFDNVTGLKINDRVYLSGIKVGYVKSIKLNKDLQPIVMLWVKKDIGIPSDSYVNIENMGIAGKVRVVIEPGMDDFIENNGWFEYTSGTFTLGRLLSLLEKGLEIKVLTF